ncbi:K02A2.6-like [Cordylochernes scorpioides]|uniref:RNA-directed DNA polymerase n=1 Tax=Cordylochernes scorpioides TaxID=51811 RepID=A0ABY6KYD1_9ARAC|nr:K02A2.6-like [Cordylochernes scorpioides]
MTLSRRRGKLYAFFIDLRKAFDTVPHHLLWKKLALNGLSCRFIKQIKNYNPNDATVRWRGSFTEAIKIQAGVLQGEPLSPYLFILFLNDLVPLFDKSELPGINLENYGTIHLLLYADDIVILGESKINLQLKINLLEKYLEENCQNKSKIMVFRNVGRTARSETWFWGQQPLTIVDKYTYICRYPLTTKILTQNASQYFRNKALNAINALWRILTKARIKFFTSVMKLLDTVVLPTLLYAAPIWAINQLKTVNNIQDAFLRHLLDLPNFTPGYILRRECGRISSELNAVKLTLKCGASKFHPYKDCPAKEVKCHKCKKVGHFAKVCYNKTVGQVTQGPRQVKLHVMGKFTALIEKDGRSIPGEIFVVPQLIQPFLSGKASESLNLIKRLQSIEKRNSLNLFEEYPTLFTGLGTLHGSYTIKLKDESQPHAIYTPRRIPIPPLNKTKEQLDQMVEKRVIEKVEQPTDWCAPMVIVPKPSSNDLSICVDLTALNKFVKREHYLIPSVEYTLAQMGGTKLFSKLDANSGFWQIPLSEESSSLTTFLTPFGRYRFKRLPFGISSAPEVFQRKMSNLLESQSGVNCHMDDIVIWGATQEEHNERLRCVLRKLQDSGLTLNKEKCIFSVKEIKFLSHLITERGVLPDPNKVQVIREFPSPSSISEVRRFLGMVNFTDASSYGLGAVLLQKSEDGYQKAVAYASRTMSETEKRWAQIEKESLAIVWAYEMTPRILRLRLRMMRYSYSIHHTPGKDIVVADALSRSPIKISHEKDLENEIYSFVQQITSCPPFKDENMKEIWQYQNEERECREIKYYCEKGWPTKNELSAEVKAFWFLRYEMSVIDGLLMRNSRIYIPKSLSSKVLNSLHEGHLGIEKCRGRARSSVWWPRISQEFGELVRNCPNCIEERSNPQQPLIVSDFPSRPWEKTITLDFQSWHCWRIKQHIQQLYIASQSLLAMEYPKRLDQDNGPQFGLEFKKFAKEYGFHHITSSPRFPQSNGFIETMVKNIKNQLKKGRDPYLSLLGYRTAPLENGYSPAELCMNRKLRTTVPTSPVQLQSRIPDLENLEMRGKNQRHKKKTHFDIHHRARELPHLDEGTRVWVKDLRVPGVVLEDAGSPRSYIVNSPKGILRRNRFHLLPNPQGEKIDMEDEEMESPEMSQCFTSIGDNTTCDSEPRTFQRSPEPVKTWSGRVLKPPDRLNL